MKTALIAPCGMNCNICMAYLRDRNTCPGCRKIDACESSYGRKCIIRSCPILKKNNWKYCSDICEKFPCKRLKGLDKRYGTKYEMSMIENLQNIKIFGIRKFIEKEKKRWIEGNKIYCVHKKQYYSLK